MDSGMEVGKVEAPVSRRSQAVLRARFTARRDFEDIEGSTKVN
jgi:hypothetical protein